MAELVYPPVINLARLVFRAQGLRFAFVDTGLDDAHIPARRAYEAVGFDRRVPVAEFWQDLWANNPGSMPE